MHAKQPAMWSIPEQVVHDSASGVTLEFRVTPEGRRVLRILGDLPFGSGQFELSPETPADRSLALSGSGATP